jgi:hypothetical protein
MYCMEFRVPCSQAGLVLLASLMPVDCCVTVCVCESREFDTSSNCQLAAIELTVCLCPGQPAF